MDQYWSEMTEQTINVFAMPVISKERRESIMSLFGKGDNKDNRRPSNISNKSSTSYLQWPVTRNVNVRRESNMSVDFLKDYNDIVTNNS